MTNPQLPTAERNRRKLSAGNLHRPAQVEFGMKSRAQISLKMAPRTHFSEPKVQDFCRGWREDRLVISRTDCVHSATKLWGFVGKNQAAEIATKPFHAEIAEWNLCSGAPKP